MADRAHIADCILPALPQDVRSILEFQLLGPQVCARFTVKGKLLSLRPQALALCRVPFSASMQRL